jgi:hypothetical protein
MCMVGSLDCLRYVHDHAGVPEDGVVVVAVGGVEPGAELHLAAADAVGEDVGVEGVGEAAGVAQELEVDLVVFVADGRCVVGGDGAGRVALHKLDASRHAAVDELLLGPEHTTCSPVHIMPRTIDTLIKFSLW